MKLLLSAVIDLQHKYVELHEYRKFSCQDVNAAVPELKIAKFAEDSDNELSETKLEQIKINKRKRRKYMNSFFYSANLIEWTNEEINCQEPRNIYNGTTLMYYEASEKTYSQVALLQLVR